jgi:TPR repeat protein
MLDYDESGVRNIELDRGDILNVVSNTLLKMNRAGLRRPTSLFHPIGLDRGVRDSIEDALQFEAAIHLVIADDSDPGPLVGMALLRDLVKRRYLAAIRAVGLLCVHGRLSGGPVKAKAWFERGIEAGSVECLFELARIYDRGEGVALDQLEAHRLYELSAEAGDYRGQHALASRLGRGVPVKDDARAFGLLLRSAEHGYAPAELALGGCYEYGLGVAKNVVEAVKWYEKAAESGDVPEAIARLTFLCLGNPEFPGFTDKAVKWSTEGAAKGLSLSRLLLGKIHGRGVGGVPKDARKAVEWFIRAAEDGSEIAILHLVLVYSGGFLDVAPDPELAVKWAMRGLELNLPAVKYVLSRMYRSGKLLERDIARAERLESELDRRDVLAAKELMTALEAEFSVDSAWDGFGF